MPLLSTRIISDYWVNASLSTRSAHMGQLGVDQAQVALKIVSDKGATIDGRKTHEFRDTMSQICTDKAVAAEERTEEARSFVRKVKAATRRKHTSEEKIRTCWRGSAGR